MTRLIALFLVVALAINGCASAKQFENDRMNAQRKAEAELTSIDNGCKKKVSLTQPEFTAIGKTNVRLTKKQYDYLLCYHGAKYVAFQEYVQDKAAWKINLQKNVRTVRQVYLGRISKQRSIQTIAQNDAEFRKKESIIVTKMMNDMRAKDQKGNSAVFAGLALAAIIAVVAVAASGSGYGGSNSYSGSSYSSYSGNCMCPYNLDAAGRRCGNRSAWSRSGGASPVCY